MSKLVVYDPVFGGFFLKSDKFDAVRRRVHADLGEATFKLGYSDNAPDGATKALRAAFKTNDISAVIPQGVVTHIGYAEQGDSQGNTYKKLRVTLKHEDSEFLMSVEMGTDVAKRLISKLANYQPGQQIKISAWAMIENKGNRSYINHSVSVKTIDGSPEVPAKEGLFALAKQNAEQIIKVANLTDERVIQSLKRSEQDKVFMHELEAAAERLRETVGV